LRRFLLTLACGAVAMAADPPKYTGPGSCSSPSCHGGVQARSDTDVWQNEYSTWVVKDKHAQAYAVLSSPVAVRMAKILELPSPITAPKCLACHALDVPIADRARTFDLTDGVSCESCHGPASNWLGPHTTRGWTHAQSVQAGMYDTRDLVRRSEKCLSCHLGNADKTVDHEMIAAGHPDLYFELASFSAVMPRHWQEPSKIEPSQKDPWLDVRTLAAGQAVQLREQLRRIAREAPGPVWPQYAELDCFACHHTLTAAKDSWRQEAGYAGRRPGNPPWNLSRYAILRQLVREADSGAGQQLESEVGKLYGLVSALGSDRGQIATQAAAAAQIADRLAPRMAAAQFDQAAALRLLKNISGDAGYISGQGERSAEQAAMVLDSLFVAYSMNTKVDNAEQIRTAIHGLFQQLNDPSSYNAPRFAQQMRALNDLIR
jgi:hypothetical protein